MQHSRPSVRKSGLPSKDAANLLDVARARGGSSRDFSGDME